jgi:hypothetical protein
MSTFVYYAPGQRSLDLAKLTEQDFILISSMYGQISRGAATASDLRCTSRRRRTTATLPRTSREAL